MPTIVCPTCATKLEIDDDMIGEDVQCGSCQQIFKAEAEKKKSKYRTEDDDGEKPRRSKYRRGDEDEDRPSRRRSKSRDDDEDDEEDYEDRPRQRRKQGPENSQGMGIASLVLGIIGLVASWCCCLFLIADVLAIIFGILSLKTSGKPMGIAGMIMGIIGLFIFIVIFIIRIAAGVGAAGAGGFGGQGPFR